jgi:hypothetical protein
MAWSPVRRANAGISRVEHPGDYATPNPNHLRDGTQLLAATFPNLTKPVFERLSGRFTFESRGDIALKGAGTIRTYLLLKELVG